MASHPAAPDQIVATAESDMSSRQAIRITRRMFERLLDETGPFDWFRYTGSIDAKALGKALGRILPRSWTEIQAWMRLRSISLNASWLDTVKLEYLDDVLRARVHALYTDDEELQHAVAATRRLGT